MRSHARWLPLVAVTLAVVVPAAGCGKGAATTDMLASQSYPVGPYGTNPNDIIKDLTLRVQTGASAMPAAKKLSDYHAEWAAGTLKVLAIFGTAEWCSPCKAEQPFLIDTYNAYKSKGVMFLDDVAQKNDKSPADDATVQLWATTFQVPFDVASDAPNALGPYLNPTTFPAAIVIRLDFMEIVNTNQGPDNGWLKTTLDSALQ
jgi:thiol-disulfide isomerase/thioredoxin